MSDLVRLFKVTFQDGQQRTTLPLPRNTLDLRYTACWDHRFACDCREAEWAEHLSEMRWEFDNATKVFNAALAGHLTFVLRDGDVPCECSGCQIARQLYFRRPWHVRMEREAKRLADLRARRRDLGEDVPF